MLWDKVTESFCIEGGVIPLDDWALLRVEGRDCGPFLQGQTTNDVNALAPGTTQLSALIDRMGRVVSFFYLLKRGDDFLFCVLKKLLDRTVSRLEQYVISEDVTVTVFATDGLVLYCGPQHNGLRSECSDVFELPLFSLPALLLWTTEDRAVLDRLKPQQVAPDQLEALTFFSTFPNWNIDFDEESLINETCLENRAVSYTKGCFLGQEAAARVHHKRGAFYITVILEMEGDLPLNPPELVGQTFYCDGKKGGKVTDFLARGGRCFFRANLHRDFLIYGDAFAVHFSDSPDSSITVIAAPLQETVTLEEFASMVYHHALKIFAEKDKGEDEVIPLLESAVELNPGFSDAYESLGVMMGRKGAYDEALRCMERLLEVDPESVMAHTNKSLYLMKMGRFEEAEEEKAKATLASFKSAQGKKSTGEAEERENEAVREREKKVDMFLQVLAIDPEDLLANFNLGRLYNSSGDYALAESHLAKVLEKDGQYSAAYLELGIALNGLKRRDEAKEIYKRGLPVASAKGDQMIANRIEANLMQLAK